MLSLFSTRFFSGKTLSCNGQTIICLHPKIIPNRMESKPFRNRKQLVKKVERLAPQQIKMVRKLRSEDPSVWTINTLASLFNVRRVDISHVSPASKERQIQLDNDREALRGLPLRQRRTILNKREFDRQSKLKEYLIQLNYEFPGHKTDV